MTPFLRLFVTLVATISFVAIRTATSKNLCHESERRALLSFKNDLTTPANRLASWVDDGDCCDWDGVICHNSTGHVLELHLGISDSLWYLDWERTCLGGKIGDSLLGLKHLLYLDLSNNCFEGIKVPWIFGSMQSLRYLNLSDAGFGGMIPHQLGNLSNLRYLDIRDSLYVQNLQWLAGLVSLEHLHMEFVNLSKAYDWLQVTNSLPSLKELHLSYCSLHHFPSLQHNNFSNLAVLELSFNHPRVPVLPPPWVFRLNSLHLLDLGGNNFIGPIPCGLKNLTFLKYLDLSFNGFNSSLPSWLYIFRHLEFLALWDVDLQGATISDDIENLTLLNHLDLSNTNVRAEIPVSLRRMCNLQHVDFSGLGFDREILEVLKALFGCASERLQYLSLSNCSLTGPFPNELAHFVNLKSLDLSRNLIFSSIPESLMSLTSLRFLDLSFNKIHGPIPKSLRSLPSLESLSLSNNQLNGTLSESLGQLNKLQLIDVSDNFLAENISEVFFSNLTRLIYIDASKNSITLRPSPDWILPEQIRYMALNSWNLGPNFPQWLASPNINLEYFDVSCAGIKDTIPTWFWNLSSQFSYMNLSHNYLYGELPNLLVFNPVVPFILELDLSSNYFDGPIPLLSSNITTLDLSNNSFSGPIAKFLCYETDETKKLQILKLGKNQLSGEIPDCWTSWPKLIYLDLQSNNLTGNLPSSLGSLLKLKSLHLGNNRLSGVFHSSMQNCTGVVAIDLSENALTGEIPKWIGEKLFRLRLLKLRSNNLYGYIPQEICSLRSLIILDLAHNNLSGTIPECFSNFDYMAGKGDLPYPFEFFADADFAETPPVEECTSLVTKSIELEYSTNLYLMRIIDLANNSLSGPIPDAITNLVGLKSLNLSRNSLTGRIPLNMGNMSSLESLDLSLNRLLGDIPQSMAAMTSLSFLNLSYNNLSGRIPASTQFSTFNESGFTGNDLCGPPVLNNCSSDVAPSDGNEGKNHNHHGVGFNEFYVSMTMGLVVGFWAVVGPLLYSKSWRFRYFQALHIRWNELWVWAVVFVGARSRGWA